MAICNSVYLYKIKQQFKTYNYGNFSKTTRKQNIHSKEMLRNEGFSFSAVAKIWYKEYESEEQFKAFEI